MLRYSVAALAALSCSMNSHRAGADPITMDSPDYSAPIYQFEMANIDGKATPLAKFKGKVLLVVNVASQCGNTPQYAGLEAIYRKYKDRGLVVLGFPANEFGGQEPGTNAEIKQFCTGNYHVTFPMFSKIVVKGDGINPLYSWLVKNSDRPSEDVEWNFAKFLIGRDGKVAKRIGPRTKVETPEILAAIEAELAKKG